MCVSGERRKKLQSELKSWVLKVAEKGAPALPPGPNLWPSASFGEFVSRENPSLDEEWWEGRERKKEEDAGCEITEMRQFHILLCTSVEVRTTQCCLCLRHNMGLPCTCTLNFLQPNGVETTKCFLNALVGCGNDLETASFQMTLLLVMKDRTCAVAQIRVDDPRLAKTMSMLAKSFKFCVVTEVSRDEKAS